MAKRWSRHGSATDRKCSSRMQFRPAIAGIESTPSRRLLPCRASVKRCFCAARWRDGTSPSPTLLAHRHTDTPTRRLTHVQARQQVCDRLKGAPKGDEDAYQPRRPSTWGPTNHLCVGASLMALRTKECRRQSRSARWPRSRPSTRADAAPGRAAPLRTGLDWTNPAFTGRWPSWQRPRRKRPAPGK